ncbi:MAG: glycosyltransferase family 2 protein [Flavobacteriaceae bacterium]|nr:glycosyltransferase family 2 protein [Flavobacteriaceae bacterium]
MTVAVVILNWNGKHLLEEFLPNIVAYSKEATIYVADNASTDNSVQFITTHYKDSVNVVKNKSNGGFAKGYNTALKKIKADVYVLLNSDVEVTKDWLKPIIKQFKESANTAVIQPKLLNYKKRSHFEYAGAAGGFIDFLGYPYCRGRIFMSLEKDTQQYDDINPSIFWASGACLCIRSRIYHHLGGFDEDYFAHQEEIDLCWRVHNLGYNVNYVGASKVYHIGAATLREANPTKTFLNFRNSLYSVAKNVPKRFLLPVILIRLILDAVAGIKFALELRPIHTWAIIKAHFSFYFNLKRMLKKRRESIGKTTRYYSCKSVVWQHFVLSRNRFSDIK